MFINKIVKMVKILKRREILENKKEKETVLIIW